MFRRYAYKYVKIGDIETRYLQHGERGPQVVLIPGLGCTADIWTHNIYALGKKHRVYALDIFSGLGSRAEKRFTTEFFVLLLEGFLKHLNIERATLVGLSLGGALSLKFALQFPLFLEKLVLVGSAGLSRSATIPLRIATIPYLGELLTAPGRERSAYFVKRLICRNDLITNELIDFFYRMDSRPEAQKVFLKVVRSFCGVLGGKEHLVSEIVRNLDKLRIPVLFVWGREDRIIPVSEAMTAMAKFPDARLSCFDKCGHFPNFEQPERFNTLIRDFIAESP